MLELPYIEYNTSNKDRARENRTNQTKAEELMRSVLRKKQLGYTFLRQKMIGHFILDFYSSKLLLGIEVDGLSHENKQEYDTRRSEQLKDFGIKIIRYTNEEVYNNLDGVCESLVEEIKIRHGELKSYGSIVS